MASHIELGLLLFCRLCAFPILSTCRTRLFSLIAAGDLFFPLSFSLSFSFGAGLLSFFVATRALFCATRALSCACQRPHTFIFTPCEFLEGDCEFDSIPWVSKLCCSRFRQQQWRFGPRRLQGSWQTFKIRNIKSPNPPHTSFWTHYSPLRSAMPQRFLQHILPLSFTPALVLFLLFTSPA